MSDPKPTLEAVNEYCDERECGRGCGCGCGFFVKNKGCYFSYHLPWEWYRDRDTIQAVLAGSPAAGKLE